jgi:hypothetical protein
MIMIQKMGIPFSKICTWRTMLCFDTQVTPSVKNLLSYL